MPIMSTTTPSLPSSQLTRQRAVAVFLAFAVAYFISALIRAITATLSPTLIQEFAMTSRDLGFLAGAYFLGFSLTQLPLGKWLDRFGPKKVLLAFLSVAVVGSLAFSMADRFASLWIARALTGVGVSACLMAPLTAYRRWYEPANQLRANSWMLMTGSMGMVASTLPVQWLVPQYGWRPLFLGLALATVAAMLVIAWVVPVWHKTPHSPKAANSAKSASHELTTSAAAGGYERVFGHPYFKRHLLLGLFVYGGLVAMQTLWAVPWMIKVAAYTPQQAASGLFAINVCMLLAFWAWGLFGPALTRRGIGADMLITRGLPASFVLLTAIVTSPYWQPALGIPVWVLWAAYCVSCTFVAPAQPAMAQAFPPEWAGRALSAYNLLIFVGVFIVQWGVGLMIDGFRQLGLAETPAHQAAMTAYGLLGLMAYLRFAWGKATAHGA